MGLCNSVQGLCDEINFPGNRGFKKFVVGRVGFYKSDVFLRNDEFRKLMGMIYYANPSRIIMFHSTRTSTVLY
jgi:hypothetical protein